MVYTCPPSSRIHSGPFVDGLVDLYGLAPEKASMAKRQGYHLLRGLGGLAKEREIPDLGEP